MIDHFQTGIFYDVKGFSNMGAEFSTVMLLKMVGLCWRGRESLGKLQFIHAICFEGIGGTVDAFICVREPLGEDVVLDVGCLIYSDNMWGIGEAQIQVVQLWDFFGSYWKVIDKTSKELFEQLRA